MPGADIVRPNDAQPVVLARRIELRRARYLGGHPKRPLADTTRFFYLSSIGVEFRTGMTPVTISWASVTAVRVVDADTCAGVLTGAMAHPPRVDLDASSAYLLIESSDGAPVFEVPGLSPAELLVVLQPVGRRVVGGAPDDVTAEGGTTGAGAIHHTGSANGAPGEVTSDHVASDHVASDHIASDDGAPDDLVSDDLASDDGAPADGAPAEVVFEGAATEDGGPDRGPPEDRRALGEIADEDVELNTSQMSALGLAGSGEDPIPTSVVTEPTDPPELADERDSGGDPATNVRAGPARSVEATDPSAPPVSGDRSDSGLEGALECPNGHRVPSGTRFCHLCGLPLVSLRCPSGHDTLPGAIFCQVCGTDLRGSGEEPAGGAFEAFEQDVRRAAERLENQQDAQAAEIAQWIERFEDRANDGGNRSAADEGFLPLRKKLHELHIELKRAELRLAEAQAEAAKPAELELTTALVELRRIELNFSIQMLLEVTELIALPRNDDEGKQLVHMHMSPIFSECDDQRLAAALRYARAGGEPHAIRAAELELETTTLHHELVQRRAKGGLAQREEWRLEDELLSQRVAQLEARRAAAIAAGDFRGTDDAEDALDRAREEQRAHSERRPGSPERQRRAPLVEDMARAMPTVFANGERVPQSPDRRVGMAKRAIGEFRSFFDEHPAPSADVPDELAATLRAEWDEYGANAQRLVGAPVVVPGRSTAQTRVQWIKYDQLILNAWTKRISVVSTELEVAEQAKDEARAEALQVLLELVTQSLRLNAAAARVEAPAI